MDGKFYDNDISQIVELDRPYMASSDSYKPFETGDHGSLLKAKACVSGSEG